MLNITSSERDSEGYIVDPGNWNRELARHLVI